MDLRVTYGYDSAGRVDRGALHPADQLGNTNLTVETVLLDEIGHSAFGAVQSWAWGNSSPTAINVYTCTFDLDGRVTSYPLGNVAMGGDGLTRTLTYDAASNITAFTHTGHATASSYDQTFAYDGLNRLKSYSAGISTQSYTYDASGNRTQIAFSGAAYAHTVSPTSNRLNSTAGPSPAKTNSFDASGNLKSDGTVTYSYSDRGRMSSSQAGVVSASYLYNGLGQRVSKVTPLVHTGRTVYAYDEQGRVIGEYYGDGRTQQETVYFGDLPVVVLTPGAGETGTLTQVFYVYTDHIDTPRVITSAATASIVWRWDSTDPFGLAQANENPSAEGAFVYGMRFPGQIFDKETNNHYNYFRDNDPQTGRYIQSDPIGLDGGINTYGYVGGNPLTSTDPNGLNPVMAVARAGQLGWKVGDAINPFVQPYVAAGLNIVLGDPMEAANAKSVAETKYCPPDKEECDKQWRAARQTCRALIYEQMQQRAGRRKPRSVTGVTGGYTDVEECARGLVSEECGGNKKKY